MTRPLRQRHRRLVAALGVLLPIAFTMGIAARRPVPSVSSLPAELAVSPRAFAVTVWERADLFTRGVFRVRLLQEQAGAGRLALEFLAAKTFLKPDLIVYWVAGHPNITDTLPDEARLLGAFDAAVLPLPVGDATESGALLLYSLADHEIVDVSQPIRLNESAK